MKITSSQLRKIIKEEAARIRLGEGPTGSALPPRETYYDDRVSLLSQALTHLDKAIDMMQQVADMDLNAPGGDDPDVQSATMDLDNTRGFITDILAATEVLADSAGSGV